MRTWTVELVAYGDLNDMVREWVVTDGIANTIAHCDTEEDARRVADALNEKEQRDAPLVIVPAELTTTDIRNLGGCRRPARRAGGPVREGGWRDRGRTLTSFHRSDLLLPSPFSPQGPKEDRAARQTGAC